MTRYSFLNTNRCSSTGVKCPRATTKFRLEQARIAREGADCTAVAIGSMVDRTLSECEKLAEEGIAVEVIDPRTIAPLDMETIFESVRKTGRLLIVDETFQPCGIGAEIAAQVIDAGFDDLGRADQAPQRRARADALQPAAGALDNAAAK